MAASRARSTTPQRPVRTTVRVDGSRLRVRPWRGRTSVAEIAAEAGGPYPTPAAVDAAVGHASGHGFDLVVTPALARSEWRPYLDAGFEVREHLHLLSHDLLDLPSRVALSARRVSRRDQETVLAIDHRAFDAFWRLDAEALADAVRATPSTRFRIVDPLGYALVGRARDRGYVQRLAVDPSAQGNGIGTSLLLDGLWWLRRWRVREALVNTQTVNERAVELYERVGFRHRRNGLAVLQRTITAGTPATSESGAGE